MWLKYYLVADDLTLGVKMHPKKNSLVIGGYTKHFEAIESIRVNILEKQQYKTSFPCANKMTMSLGCTYKQFVQFKDECTELGYLLQRTNSLGRLIR